MPAVNFGTTVAAMFIVSPVRGCTPWRAARSATLNLPKPASITSPPRLRTSSTVSSAASIASADCLRVRPLRAATASTSWDFVTASVLLLLHGRSGEASSATGSLPIGEDARVPLNRIAWLVTVAAALITALLLFLSGYNGYGALAIAVGLCAAINLA